MDESMKFLRQTESQLAAQYGNSALGQRVTVGRFIVADGTIEALKWMALVLMVLDHINKYFFAEQLPGIFPIGRIVMPIFGFVLAYNLARPDAHKRGVHGRMMRRLALMGLIASPIVILLNGTVVSHDGWWPLNILWTLLLVVTLVYLIERGGVARYAVAVALFIVGGALVEYLWMGVLACLGAWAFCREASSARMLAWFLGTLSLSVVNANTWALVAIPIVWAASKVTLRIPRSKWVFYAFYPAHLGALLAVKKLGLY